MKKTTFSAQETERFAENLAESLKAGDVLALYGNLGAGKTTFVKGLALGLGYKNRVFSPTFIFVRPYKIINNKRGIDTLYHIDLYRASVESDLKTIGVDEFINDERSVSAIEWPEKIEGQLLKNTVRVTIEVISENKRRISLVGKVDNL